MLWYENVKPTFIYNNVLELQNRNPNLKTEEAIIFLVNFDNGFGSNLTVIVQNSLYFKTINPKLHCLGHFSENGLNFKYHDTAYSNSFFQYFKYLKDIPFDTKCYFLKMNLLPDHIYPFIRSQSVNGLNVDNITINKLYSDHFKINFQANNCVGMNIKSENELPLIGIHVRSLAQILVQTLDKQESIEDRIVKLKKELDLKYVNYNIFLATDVSDYINIVSNIFSKTNVKVYYNKTISRIDNHGNGVNGLLYGYNDSVINLSEFTGLKLGHDIISDCLSLVACDYYYVSVTNIAFITSFLTNKNNGIHYN